jgi:hypothetical protein
VSRDGGVAKRLLDELFEALWLLVGLAEFAVGRLDELLAVGGVLAAAAVVPAGPVVVTGRHG